MNIIQKEKSIRFDIDNVITDADKTDKSTSWYLLDNINQAAEIIHILSPNQDFDKCLELVSQFVDSNKIDIRSALYLKIYFIESEFA